MAAHVVAPPGGSGRAAARRGVVQVVQAIDRGGLEMLAVDLAIALHRRGVPTSVVGLDAGGRLESRLAEADVPFHLVGDAHFASLSTHLRLARLLRRLRPAAVHTHHLPSLLNGVAAAHAAGARRVVHTEHAFEYLRDAPRLRLALRTAARGVRAFTVVGAEQAGFYVHVVGVPAHKVRVVPNGVDLSRFQPLADRAAARAALGLPAGLLVGAVGRLAPEKNFALLLRAVAAARAAGAPLAVALVGDGEEHEALVRLAAALGIADHVHFLGWRQDVPALLQAFDVFALTSDTEGLPLVVLEAMACGVPVVSTAVGDVPRVLDGGRVGLLADVGDAPAIARHLAALAADRDARDALGAAARAHVVRHYSHAAMVDAYLDTYGLA